MFFLTFILTLAIFWQALRGSFSAGWLAGKTDYLTELIQKNYFFIYTSIHVGNYFIYTDFTP